MEADTFDLTKWNYAEVEYILQDYARSVGTTYDERKPLSFIGKSAGRRALDGLGLTAKQIHTYSGFEYATVTGWFRIGRDPSSPTFKNGIFPALCEAYVRLHEQEPQHQNARDAYVKSGHMDEDYRIAVERKIATLVCTGALVTREERVSEYERDRESYHRAVLRFASVYLNGRELHSLADVTLGILNAHAAKPSLAAEPEADRLADIMRRTQWYWHADKREDFENLFDDVAPEHESLFVEAGLHICTTYIEEYAMDGFLESLSDEDLMNARDAIREVMESRELV